MGQVKYVITYDGVFGSETAIIFDQAIGHDVIAGSPVAAGFVGFSANRAGFIEVMVNGESVSLNLKNRGVEDARLVCRALNGGSKGLFVRAKSGGCGDV